MAGLVDGVVAGQAAPLWSAIVPQTGQNLITNPSLETGTTGWAATSGAISRVIGGVRGAYMGRLLASATNGRADFALPQATAGQPVTLSLWIKADSASVFLQLIQDAATVEQAHPGDGAWHRIEVTAAAATATTRSLRVIDKRSSAWTNVDFDAAQYESGVSQSTSYLDGDQDGCSWDAGPHASTSTRDARDSRGGAVTAFETLGLLVKEQPGIGLPKLAVGLQEFALADGSLYQQTRASERVVTLLALIQGDGTTAGLHAARRTVVDALNPETRTGRGPVVLRDTVAATTKRLVGYYEGGLEWQDIYAATETVPLRFLAPDPYFEGETDSQVQLTANQSLASVSAVAQRSATGVWSTMNGGFPAPTTVLDLKLDQSGAIYAGGSFSNVSPDTASFLVRWDGSAWRKLGAASPSSNVHAIAVHANGDISIGGVFTTIGAVGAVRIAKYTAATGVWSTYGTGMNGAVNALAIDGTGQLWAGGSFTTANGVAISNGVAIWDGATFYQGLTGTIGTPSTLALAPDGTMVAGSSTGVFAQVGPNWVQIGAAAANVNKVIWGPDGRLYAFGNFTAISGVAAAHIARWNGSAWEPLGAGLNGNAWAGSFLPNGDLVVSGEFSASNDGVQFPDAVGVWNGSSWAAFDIALPHGAGGNVSKAVLAHPSGAVTLGWSETGTAVIPVVVTATNGGTAVAYPVVSLRIDTPNNRLYSLVNLTTGQAIRFNLLPLAGEKMTLDLRPGRRTFVSDSRGLIQTVRPGSDLATWGLAPGANRVALFGSDASTVAAMWWRSRYLSAD